MGLYASVVLVIGKFVREFFSGISHTIMFEELPNVDRILKLCTDIFLVRETGELDLEEDMYAKLIFLYRSPETMIKWTREKTEWGGEGRRRSELIQEVIDGAISCFVSREGRKSAEDQPCPVVLSCDGSDTSTWLIEYLILLIDEKPQLPSYYKEWRTDLLLYLSHRTWRPVDKTSSWCHVGDGEVFIDNVVKLFKVLSLT